LIPGLGSDFRIFSKVDFSNFDTTVIERPRPQKHESMVAYAARLAQQIDTTQSFSILGVSHGGMLALEIGKILKVNKIILVSSAANSEQLPFKYRFQKKIPVYKIFSGRMLKRLSFIAQPIFEPDSRNCRTACKAMLKAKDPYFLKRGTAMIIKWEQVGKPTNVIQIHGEEDHAIPIKKVKAEYIVKNGSHMMSLTQPGEISSILTEIFEQ
jgi:esterase/lipase